MKKAISGKNDLIETRLADAREELAGLMDFPDSEFVKHYQRTGVSVRILCTLLH